MGGDRSLGVPSVQCPNLFEKFSEQLVVTPKNMEIFLKYMDTRALQHSGNFSLPPWIETPRQSVLSAKATL